MHSALRRAALAVGVTLCGLLLVGCDARGTILVQADDQLVVDVTVSGTEPNCPESLEPLTVVVAPSPNPPVPGATVGCRITGTLSAAQLGQVVSLVTVGDYQAVTVAWPTGQNEIDSVDLALRFPGQVVESRGGQIEGDSVRVVKPADLSDLRVVARNRPGLPEEVLWTATGAAAGVVGTLLAVGAVWVFRRRRADAVSPSGLSQPETDPASVTDGPDAAIASQAEVSEQDPAASSAPTPPDGPAPPGAEATAYDHSIWAPPEEDGTGPID